MTADPIVMFGKVCDKFRSLWEAVEATDKPDEGESENDSWHLPFSRSSLSRHGSEELREAALSFSARTCSTYDGLHPRQFAWPSDDALETLGLILDVCEGLGQWPTCIDAMVATMIPKPKGGGQTHRPLLWGLPPVGSRAPPDRRSLGKGQPPQVLQRQRRQRSP